MTISAKLKEIEKVHDKVCAVLDLPHVEKEIQNVLEKIADEEMWARYMSYMQEQGFFPEIQLGLGLANASLKEVSTISDDYLEMRAKRSEILKLFSSAAQDQEVSDNDDGLSYK